VVTPSARQTLFLDLERTADNSGARINMRATLCVFMLLAGTASFQVFATEHTFGPHADHCPKLPEGSGYVWEWVFSIDYGYCIGRVAKTHKPAFEIGTPRLYGVMPPDLVDPETSLVKLGSVAGTPVRWYSASRHKGAEKLAYRTFTLVDEKNERYLEVSVYAASESQMKERLSVLERMQYR
jgi:hypothetical protein